MIDKGLDGRGLYRSIYCAIWSNGDFKKFSPEVKLVFFHLRTSPLTNLIALYPFWIEPIEQQTGLSREAIQNALDTLLEREWISIEDGIVWIRKGLRFDPQISLANENHFKAVKKAILALPRLQIVRDFIDFYGIRMAYPIPSRSHPQRHVDPNQECIEVPYEIRNKDEGEGKGKAVSSKEKEKVEEEGKQNPVSLSKEKSRPYRHLVGLNPK